MYTVFYKGFPIHGYIYKGECRIQLKSNSVVVKSLLAAKQFITRNLDK